MAAIIYYLQYVATVASSASRVAVCGHILTAVRWRLPANQEAKGYDRSIIDYCTVSGHQASSSPILWQMSKLLPLPIPLNGTKLLTSNFNPYVDDWGVYDSWNFEVIQLKIVWSN